MNSKTILVFLMTVFAALTIAAFASARDLGVSNVRVSINGVDTINSSDVISGQAGDTIPLKVVFTADENASDVKVKADISGSRDDIQAETGRFDMIEGNTYSKLLSLTLPTDIDPSQALTLTIEIQSLNMGKFEQDFPITAQRESYKLNVLDVETAQEVTAGSNLAVNVVLRNSGSHRLDDNFVTVSIPALNIEKRAYFSDLTPTDVANPDISDATERTMFLQIPSDAKAGVYTLEVDASNADADTKATQSIAVTGNGQTSQVLSAATSKDIAAGQTATYDLVIINSGDKLGVYNIVPENAQNLVVSVDEPIVTVPADSSKTVTVRATAGDVMGTFNFAVNVNSQDQLVQRATFTANVSKAAAISNNVMVLTVILAIIFVVLLIVLIVLLTRKPAKTEEFGESYY